MKRQINIRRVKVIAEQNMDHYENLTERALKALDENPSAALQLAQEARTLGTGIGQIERHDALYYVIGKIYRHHYRLPEALKLLNKAQRLAAQYENTYLTVCILRELAAVYTIRANFPKAINLIKQAQAYELDAEQAYLTQAVYAEIILSVGLYQQATKILTQIHCEVDKAQHPRVYAVVQAGLGAVQFLMEQYPQALEHYQIAFEEFTAQDNVIGIVEHALIICQCLVRLDRHADCAYYIDIVQAAAQRYSTPKVQSGLANFAAIQAKLRQDYVQAEQDHLLALQHARSMGDPAFLFNLLNENAWLHLERKMPQGALRYLAEAAAIALSDSGFIMRAVAHYFFSTAYEQLDQPARALQHYKCFQELQNKHLGHQIRSTIAVIMAEFEWQLERIQLKAAERQTRTLARDVERQKRELSNYALSLQQKNRALQEIRSTIVKRRESGQEADSDFLETLLHTVDGHLTAKTQWDHFEQQFNLVHREYSARLAERYPALTASELKICLLLKLYLSSQEISQTLNISLNTVYTHRQKIRRKLALGSGRKLITHLQEI